MLFELVSPCPFSTTITITPRVFVWHFQLIHQCNFEWNHKYFAYKLYRRPLKPPSFKVVMKLTIKSVFFSFNYEMYKQIDRVSMSSSLGVIQENIFEGFHEKLVFDKFPKPYFYVCYVDDSFDSFSSYHDKYFPTEKPQSIFEIYDRYYVIFLGRFNWKGNKISRP